MPQSFDSQSSTITVHKRLLSLDVFRGATVAAMILVNNPGDWGHIYSPLEHSDWNGCTPADLIFPFFLFIVGVSVAYSLGNKVEAIQDHSILIFSILKRSFILFGLGIMLAFLPRIFFDPLDAFNTFRIPGILQRIAFVYFFTAIIFLKTNQKTQFRILILLLVIYWILMMFVPVPGVRYPNLEKETNLGAWIDRSILTIPHLWKESKTWDPEGILGIIPSVSTGLFGVLTGTFLRRKDISESEKISWIFSIGTISVIAGLAWSLEFPINKALWTSSYVLYTGGLAMIALALCYWIIDVQGYTRWTKPFVVYGINAVTIFVLSAILVKSLTIINVKTADGSLVASNTWLFEKFFAPYFSPFNASLAWGVSLVLLWMSILWWMYNKKIIIKV